jgi:putative phosphoribosyl transferase
MNSATIEREEIHIPAQSARLAGILTIPKSAKGIVIFAHGRGGGRLSPGNQFVGEYLNERDFATLHFDLLTEEEESRGMVTAELGFDIGFLSGRLVTATEWITGYGPTAHLSKGYFGEHTGAAAALVSAAWRKDVAAIVSQGGRPDLAGEALVRVSAPTLLIVGGDDEAVIKQNRSAMRQMKAQKALEILPGATHLFEEPGMLEEVARLAENWFSIYL